MLRSLRCLFQWLWKARPEALFQREIAAVTLWLDEQMKSYSCCSAHGAERMLLPGWKSLKRQVLWDPQQLPPSQGLWLMLTWSVLVPAFPHGVWEVTAQAHGPAEPQSKAAAEITPAPVLEATAPSPACSDCIPAFPKHRYRSSSRMEPG